MNIVNQKAFQHGIIGATFFIVTTLLAGFQFENYSHCSQLISESYAVDSPYGIYLRMFGFIPSGLFIFLFSIHAKRIFSSSKKVKLGLSLFGIFYGLATVLVSIFPCDAGCNKELLDPSTSQLIHNTTGLFTYLIVPISIILIGSGLKTEKKHGYLSKLSLIFGMLSFLFVMIFFGVLTSPFIGLIQRMTEGTILVWLILFSIELKKISS
ncbi:MAG: DUF998 domain-containing protein [Bacteroidia bacterium]